MILKNSSIYKKNIGVAIWEYQLALIREHFIMASSAYNKAAKNWLVGRVEYPRPKTMNNVVQQDEVTKLVRFSTFISSRATITSEFVL